MSIRAKFVEEFGEEQASLLEQAAHGHNGGFMSDHHSNFGSDPFKWVITQVISYECVSNKSYAEGHGLDLDADKFKAWVKENADLGSHDGDIDTMGFLCGVYSDYLPAGGE